MTSLSPRVVIELDGEVGTAYIRLSAEAVATTHEVSEDVLVDLDAMGVAVGVEVLRLTADLPFQRLTTEYHVHSAVIDLLRRIRPSVAAFVVSSASEAATTAGARVSGSRQPVST
ncbi:MAG TPA: DUF2283 domain-containing protein [Propionicimonas sp.]